MKYKISEKRTDFLREKFFEYSFREIDLDTKTLDSIIEPVELDFIAKNHNYDDGNEILFYIINNPICDFSTVKMIFFRADVDGYINLKEKSFDYELITAIIRNCEQNFYQKEKFYYNPDEDFNALEFDIDRGKNIFPPILFSKPKGRKLEPNFAEDFQNRNISTLKEKISIKKNLNSITCKYLNLNFEYQFPDNFELIQDDVIEKFIEDYKFPEYLKGAFGITEKQLKKVVIKPEFVISDKNLLIGLFVFNSSSLLIKNQLTNVATIMRDEFSYIQAFFQVTLVEENFDKIKRIKLYNNWFALSKLMQIKIETIENEKYLKLLLFEKSGLLLYFFIASNPPQDIENETIENLLLNNIEIQ